ncbi:MAG: hypothetical protein QG596_2007 [Actinomycetota bacterium]|jgi:protein-disulfide isomerase|nr:hypothetical protein [Actinomycetota bacterium]
MATGPQQKRKELREKRLKAEASAQGADRRKNLGKIIGISAFLAVVAVVIVVVALSSGGDDGGSGGNKDWEAQLAGLTQSGNMLGEPNAPVTLVEFGDLQCPICKQYADEILPDVIAGPVKDGTANMEFENWAILGPDSSLAAKAALAAGEQNKMWSFIEAFYANQGLEGSGYVTDDFLTDVANEAGVPDIDQWNTDREAPALDAELTRVDATATNNGFSGTPSFAIREADGSLTPIADTQSSEALIKAINDAADAAKSGNDSGNDQ